MGQPSRTSAVSGIGVLDKTVAILAALADGPQPLGGLSDATGLPRATAHRLAVGLEAHQLLARDADGRFVLGPRIAAFAAASPDPLVGAATPVLAWVRDEAGESAQLYRRDGAERVCVATAERTHGLRTAVPVGSRLPMSAGSGAQVLSAWADRDAARELLGQSEFDEPSLQQARQQGWAQSVAQREAGVASVSAPVFSADGELLAAISISGPIERLGRTPGRRFGPLLVSAAGRITAAMYGTPA